MLLYQINLRSTKVEYRGDDANRMKVSNDFRIYGSYIPKLKFDSFKISIPCDVTEIGKISSTWKMSTIFIIHYKNAENLLTNYFQKPMNQGTFFSFETNLLIFFNQCEFFPNFLIFGVYFLFFLESKWTNVFIARFYIILQKIPSDLTNNNVVIDLKKFQNEDSRIVRKFRKNSGK